MPEDRFLLLNVQVVPPGGFRYVQPESGKQFSASNFRALKDQVAQHRRSNGYPIGTDFDAELQDWICKRITDAGMHCYERGKVAMQSYSAGNTSVVGTGYQGQAKWRELHLYALTERPADMERAAWLANFANSLPCGECKLSWKQLVRRNPLQNKASAEQFFQWTVDRHNDVNRKLGKPVISHEEAKAIYL